MTQSRVERALARLESALERIAAARQASPAKPADAAGSARVMALVNSHEKLREEVADTIGDLDALIAELEGTDAP
jgi:two-component sensor histidine kinase